MEEESKDERRTNSGSSRFAIARLLIWERFNFEKYTTHITLGAVWLMECILLCRSLKIFGSCEKAAKYSSDAYEDSCEA